MSQTLPKTLNTLPRTRPNGKSHNIARGSTNFILFELSLRTTIMLTVFDRYRVGDKVGEMDRFGDNVEDSYDEGKFQGEYGGDY